MSHRRAGLAHLDRALWIELQAVGLPGGGDQDNGSRSVALGGDDDLGGVGGAGCVVWYLDPDAHNSALAGR